MKISSGVLMRRLLASNYNVSDMNENSTIIIPPTPKPSGATIRSCDHIDTEYNIALAIICAMCFVFGIIYTFFGKYMYYFVHCMYMQNLKKIHTRIRLKNCQFLTACRLSSKIDATQLRMTIMSRFYLLFKIVQLRFSIYELQ